MGNSKSHFGLTADVLEEYETLTYLSKGEILYLMTKFQSLGQENLELDLQHRFHRHAVVSKFPMLKNNPFQDRLFRVFSSRQDDRFSFEDMLDLCSAMSASCPPDVKAAWAFRVYDIDEDNQIGKEDICEIVDRLAWDKDEPDRCLNSNEKEKIAAILLQEMKLQSIGSIGLKEFQIAMTKLPEFSHAFYFRL